MLQVLLWIDWELIGMVLMPLSSVSATHCLYLVPQPSDAHEGWVAN